MYLKHTVIDFQKMTETIVKDGRKHEYPIEELEVYESYLHYKRNYVNHPYHQRIEYHLFPEENIGIYSLVQYKDAVFDKSDVYKYYVDMVGVEKADNKWSARDLYLDFMIMCDDKYYVVDVDEFNEAIKEKQLGEKEVSDALTGLDNILKGYYEGFDIEKYIASLKSKHGNKLLFSKSK